MLPREGVVTEVDAGVVEIADAGTDVWPEELEGEEGNAVGSGGAERFRGEDGGFALEVGEFIPGLLRMSLTLLVPHRQRFDWRLLGILVNFIDSGFIFLVGVGFEGWVVAEEL
jgi:hypothetical protein